MADFEITIRGKYACRLVFKSPNNKAYDSRSRVMGVSKPANKALSHQEDLFSAGYRVTGPK